MWAPPSGALIHITRVHWCCRGFSRVLFTSIYISIREHTTKRDRVVPFSYQSYHSPKRDAATRKNDTCSLLTAGARLCRCCSQNNPPTHPPTPTAFPEGLTWRQCMRHIVTCHPHDRPCRASQRALQCPLVCACSESTPHHERATKALPNSPSFPHSPSSVRLLTSSHIICSACRNRSPLTRHLGCWTLRLPPP